MKPKLIICFFLLLSFIFSCNLVTEKAKKGDCIINFEYFKHDDVGPESLVSIVQIQNNELKEILLRNPRVLVYNYVGGIYDIDSLYFPKPQIEIYNHKDSSLIFDQSVFKLRLYSKEFIDSIMKLTKTKISIEVTDTISKKKWTLGVCK